MRHRSKMARAAGLGALATCGLLLNQAGPTRAQSPASSAGDTTPGARPGSIPRNPAGGQQILNGAQPGSLPVPAPVARPEAPRGLPPGTLPRASGVGQDTQMLIAHGLDMAIEGSTLQALAARSGGAIAGASAATAPGVRPNTLATDPVSVSRIESPGTAPPGLSRAPGAPGTALTGAPATGGPGVAVATPTGARPEAPGLAAVPAATGSTGDILRQQATMSFAGSDRLLAQAARDGADPRLQQAAVRYAAALRGLGVSPASVAAGRAQAGSVGNGTGGSGTFPSATSATGLGGTGNPIAGPGGVPTPEAGMTDADLAAVAAINHGVKEAIGALRIRQMVRASGSSESPAAQTLLTHGREMDSQSLAMIRAVTGGNRLAPGSPVPTLAQQASDLIQVLQAIGN